MHTRDEPTTADSLLAASQSGAVLLVFLRHLAWVFCREAIADLAGLHEELEKRDISVVLVHPGSDAAGQRLLAGYPGTSSFRMVADPTRALYAEFGLSPGTTRQVMGAPVWARGVAALLAGHRVGKLGPDSGDTGQMPGVFVLIGGEVAGSFRHRYSSDRPNYLALVDAALSSGAGTRGMPSKPAE